jgi:HlyD family secretion protein
MTKLNKFFSRFSHHRSTDKPCSKKNLWQKFKCLKFRWKLLLFIIVITVIWSNYSSHVKKQRAAANLEVVAVTRGDITREAVRTGKVELQGVINVKPPLSGVLTELNVYNGQTVTEGDVLFKVKTTATEAQQAAAWASFVAARNAYEDAKINIGNTEWASFESAKQSVITAEKAVEQFEQDHPDKKNDDDKDYQSLLQALKVARLTVDMQVQIPARVDDRIEQARADYLAASAAYQASKDGTYRSPISGRVENLGVNLGENVIADVGDKEGTPLFLIVPAGNKTISMSVGANDAMTLEVGQTASVRSNLTKNATFSAQIVRVDKVGRSGDSGLTYRAWLKLDDAQDQLLLGIPVEISIQTGASSNTLIVPSLAVVNDTVTVVDQSGAELEKRPVEVGLRASGQTEIISGLEEGEYVLVNDTIF